MMRSKLKKGLGRPRLVALLAAGAVVCAAAALGARVPVQNPSLVRVLIETELGEIEVELDAANAPVTTANFLRYLDAGRYNGGGFNRSVRLDNQTRDDVLIEVIQAGPNPEFRRQGSPPIELERTRDTGLKHLDGTLSMARGGPDTASSGFFICINDQPSLDFGGDRNDDGQGFAAFGQVIRGMDVVRRIHQSPTGARENLTPSIVIARVSRIE